MNIQFIDAVLSSVLGLLVGCSFALFAKFFGGNK